MVTAEYFIQLILSDSAISFPSSGVCGLPSNWFKSSLPSLLRLDDYHYRALWGSGRNSNLCRVACVADIFEHVMRQIVPHFVYFLYSFHSHSPRSPFLSFCHDSMQVNQTTALTLFLGFAWVGFGLFFLCFLNAFAFLGLLHIDFSQFVSLLLLLLLLIFIKLLFTSAPTGTAAFGSLLFWVYFTIMLTTSALITRPA